MSEAEMLKTFNCGVGMIIVTPADASEAVLEALSVAGENAHRIGVVTSTRSVAYTGAL